MSECANSTAGKVNLNGAEQSIKFIHIFHRQCNSFALWTWRFSNNHLLAWEKLSEHSETKQTSNQVNSHETGSLQPTSPTCSSNKLHLSFAKSFNAFWFCRLGWFMSGSLFLSELLMNTASKITGSPQDPLNHFTTEPPQDHLGFPLIPL